MIDFNSILVKPCLGNTALIELNTNSHRCGRRCVAILLDAHFMIALRPNGALAAEVNVWGIGS